MFNITLHAPQLVMLALVFASLGIAAAEHGKPKTGTHSFWITLIAIAINLAILRWGGFFS